MRGGGAQVSSRAHISVMQKVRPGKMEYQMEADFLHYCYYHGPRPSRSGPSRSGASSARRTGSPGCRGCPPPPLVLSGHAASLNPY